MPKRTRRIRTSIELDPIPMIGEAKADNTTVSKPTVISGVSASEYEPREAKLFEGLRDAVTASPGRFYLSDVVNKQFGLTPTVYTEKDLSPEQLKVIDDQVKHALSKKNLDFGHFVKNPNDTVNVYFNAPKYYPEMYGRQYGSQDLTYRLLDPIGQVETTLGKYNAKVHKNGYEIEDVYDFNVGQGQYKGSRHPYAVLRRYSDRIAHNSSEPDSVKNKFNIKRSW